MNIFMLVTSSGEQGMEYFGEDNPKFHQGEHVRVIDGKFKGAEGIICRIRKIAAWWSPSKAYAPWLPPIFRRLF